MLKSLLKFLYVDMYMAKNILKDYPKNEDLDL